MNQKELYDRLQNEGYDNFLVDGIHCRKLGRYDPYLIMFWKDWFSGLSVGNYEQIGSGIKLIEHNLENISGFKNKVSVFTIHWKNNTNTKIIAWREHLLNHKLIKPMVNETIESLICNPKGFNKDDCYLVDDGVLMGIDMFRFDLSSYKNSTIKKFRDGLMTNEGTKNCPLMYEMDKYHTVPVVKVKNNNEVIIEILNSDTGEQLTFQEKKVKLSKDKMNELHMFIKKMENTINKAYKFYRG